MPGIKVVVLLFLLAVVMPKISEATPFIIDLSKGSSIDEIEALLKQNFLEFERRIIIASRISSRNEVVTRVQGVEGSLLSITIGHEMTRAYNKRPVFRLPLRDSNRASPPQCGAEVQQLACSLLNRNTDGRVFLSPFDLDELVSQRNRRRRRVTPWHRNSPLISLVRICTGLKARTKHEGTETCIGPLILKKLKILVDKYNVLSAKQPSIVQLRSVSGQRQAAQVLPYGRYLTIKSILKNFDHAQDGTAAEHATNNAVDILCGPSAGINSGAEKNCSAISKLCSTTSSSNVVFPAETEGCGNAQGPLTSVHCSFYHRPLIDLGNMTATEVAEVIRDHYAPFKKQAQLAITDVVQDTVKRAVEQNMTVGDAIEEAKTQIVPKLNKIIQDTYENRIIFNVSTMSRPRNLYFRRINFRWRRPAMLRRQTRDLRNFGGNQCPSQSVEMAKKLLDLHSAGAKIFFLPDIFANSNLTGIMNSMSREITAQFDGHKTGTVTGLVQETSTASPGNAQFSVGAFENIVAMSKGYRAYNSAGNQTCISYETLYAIQKMADSFYQKFEQPLNIAALPGTQFHASSTEASTHNNGVSVDLLCGQIYHTEDTTEDSNRYCFDLINECFSSKLMRQAQLNLETTCLADSVLALYGVVHCRSR